jgi:small GTP-binding protein
MRNSLEGKVVFLGAQSVGKTSIVNRAVSDSFDINAKPTVGAQYATKIVVCDSGTTTLRIWDTAGQERYRTLAPMYYQGSQVAIVVFSLTDQGTLDEAKDWVRELTSHFGTPPKIFLVGNMSDRMDVRAVEIDKATETAEGFNATYLETSAMTGENIEELFRQIGDYVQQRHSSLTTADQMVVLKPSNRSGCDC